MEQNKRPKRPTRQRKSDRMLHSGVTQEEIQCDYALAPFDHMAHSLDLKWGVDRLVELVSPDMAERYGSAMAKLNAAIDAKRSRAGQAAGWRLYERYGGDGSGSHAGRR
jgi:hypothetical protein